MNKVINKIGGFLKSDKAPTKIEWIMLISLFIFIFISFIFEDIIITANHSISFDELLFEGKLLDLYKENYIIKNGVLTSALTYDFQILMIFGLWNLPLFLIKLFSSFTLKTSILGLLWSKTMLIAFLIGLLFIMNKILEMFDYKKGDKKWLSFLLISSPLLMMTLGMFAGYDILVVFFIFWGIYYYLKNDLIKFIIVFSFAISIKMFAVFIFVPLLLLKEKNLIKIVLYSIAGMSFTILGKVLYLNAPYYQESINFFNNVMFGRLLNNTIESPFGNIPIFLLMFFVVVIWCYFKKIKEKDFKYYVFYIGFLIFGSFSMFVEIHPQWLALLYPFTTLILFLNKDNIRKNMLLEIGLSVGFLLMMYYNYNWVFCTNLLSKMTLHSIFNNVVAINDLQILGRLKEFMPIINAVIFACLIVFGYVNHPKKWIKENTDKDEFPRGLIWIRALIVVPFVALILYYYFK